MKRRPYLLRAILAAVALYCGGLQCGGPFYGEAAGATRSNGSIPAPPPLGSSLPAGYALPRQELDFIALFGKTRQQYLAARSVSARQGARIAQQIRVHAFLGLTHSVKDWMGVFRQSQTGDEGNLSIDVEIAPGVVITTWLNRFDDARYRTMIRPQGPLAPAVRALTVGQPIRFSADLIGSVVSTDEDMVLNPRIIARFSKLEILTDPPTR